MITACCCGSGSIHVTIPGCSCTVPTPLHMTVVNPDNVFQAATLAWQTIPPVYGPSDLTKKHMLSTEAFFDNQPAEYFIYAFYCVSGYFCITRLFSAASGIIDNPVKYRWLVATGISGNSCVPFLLTNGANLTPFSASTVTISE